ncbi:RNA polymerase factor sigma-70 [Clostridium acetireducens DSM 10703]|jgi:RNA polymerase sigma factor (sigma-70 family)|uniref:RNA polymerase factor sigma-70 n=1 Tax=Clostridium acetireducens DSM 10703 TaxID=1121290 RepID=A0A1E8EZA7_9CLOT|nr:helix-turn-helix domain-containing protein [Clostridium acetireducens]OFI06500.1 RNA polymerase factor sigma-70 [Clostridium acetireducens DSM 10703]
MGNFNGVNVLAFCRKIMEGDDRAIEELIEFYQGYINSKCRYLQKSIEMYSEDIKQEIKIKIVYACYQFRGKTLKEFHSFIYKSIDNAFRTSINKYKRHTKNIIHINDEYTVKYQKEYTIEKFALYEYYVEEVKKISKPYLSEKEQFLLDKLIEEKTIKEIAEETKEKYNTVIRRKARLLNKLIKILKKHNF